MVGKNVTMGCNLNLVYLLKKNTCAEKSYKQYDFYVRNTSKISVQNSVCLFGFKKELLNSYLRSETQT